MYGNMARLWGVLHPILSESEENLLVSPVLDLA
jgi:hypothetical protein